MKKCNHGNKNTRILSIKISLNRACWINLIHKAHYRNDKWNDATVYIYIIKIRFELIKMNQSVISDVHVFRNSK